MKKRGYTLIELVAVMAILSILLGSGFTIVSIMRNLKNEVEFDYSIGEISNILSYGKAYCRKNNTSGEIIIDSVGNTISFKNNRTIVRIAEIKGESTISTSINGSNIITI
ncbi:MAG: type II secretion system protein, partial [Clostridium sp.]